MEEVGPIWEAPGQNFSSDGQSEERFQEGELRFVGGRRYNVNQVSCLWRAGEHPRIMHHQGIQSLLTVLLLQLSQCQVRKRLFHLRSNTCIGVPNTEMLVFLFLVLVTHHPGCSIVSRGGVCGDGPRWIMDRLYHCGQGSRARYSCNCPRCVICLQTCSAMWLGLRDPFRMLTKFDQTPKRTVEISSFKDNRCNKQKRLMNIRWSVISHVGWLKWLCRPLFKFVQLCFVT